MKKKILFYSVARSDYDRYLPLLNEFQLSKTINFGIAINSVHLNSKFGKTYKFIDRKFKIFKPKYTLNRFNDKKDIIRNFSENLLFLNKVLEKYKPNLLIVLGDRFEMLCGPLCAIQNNIPIIHFYGGSETKGSIDDYIRASITKMSDFHFVVNKNYKKKIYKMGEKRDKIKITGLIGFEKFIKKNVISRNTLVKKFKLTPGEFILLSFHPETKTKIKLNFQLKILENIIKHFDYKFIITYPNADDGNEKIIKFYDILDKKYSKLTVIKNCGQNLFINLIKYSKFMIGNSSAGIVEASFFKRYSINIGTRQSGKVIPKNVISVDWNENKILSSIKFAIKNEKKISKKKLISPYREMISAKEVVKFIVNTNWSNIKK